MVNKLKTSRRDTIKSAQDGEILAVSAFGFLAGEQEYFAKFAEMTGIDFNDIPEMVNSPDFLASVLTFLLSDDSMLLAFCQSADCTPEDAIRAQHFLSEL